MHINADDRRWLRIDPRDQICMGVEAKTVEKEAERDERMNGMPNNEQGRSARAPSATRTELNGYMIRI